MARILFQSENKEIEISGGSDFLEIFQKDSSLPMKFGCRRGECGVCAIRVDKGADNLSKCTSQEKATLGKKGLCDPNHRLACQCAVNGDVCLDFVFRNENPLKPGQ